MKIPYSISVAFLAWFVRHMAHAWLTVESGDYRYNVYNGTRTWPGTDFCLVAFPGTQLPLPRSKADDRRLYELLTSVFGLAENSEALMWIDARLTQTGNQSSDWVDHNGVALQYTGWADRQPDSGGVETNAVVGVRHNNLGWRDMFGGYSGGYVFCEKQKIPIPVVCTLTACDGPFLELSDCREIECLDDFTCPHLAQCQSLKQHECPQGWKVGSYVKCVGYSTALDEV